MTKVGRERNVTPMKALLTVEDLSTCLHKSVASIRSDISRNPKSLPPICRLPGTKRLLWRSEDVEQWLAGHVSDRALQAPESPPDAPKPRRGRPTKAEQIARAREASHGRQDHARLGGEG